MSDCNCNNNKTTNAVPNFVESGFSKKAGNNTQPQRLVLPENILALELSVCVSASYDAETNKICFDIPIVGKECITSPVHIPVGAEIKACVTTCDHIVPTGVRATVYLNGSSIWSGTFGWC